MWLSSREIESNDHADGVDLSCDGVSKREKALEENR
jgi:hypothetical protein